MAQKNRDHLSLSPAMKRHPWVPLISLRCATLAGDDNIGYVRSDLKNSASEPLPPPYLRAYVDAIQ
jgi:hypothetical protein